jgi:cobalt/nickel transport system ATP-binding protein
MSHHIVEVKNLYFSYPDGKEAISGISFRITHGESVAIVGANGAGKSTLLMHLNGSLIPSKGEIRIGDYPVTKETLNSIRRTVGMVFQDSDDQLFMPTVFDDVAFGPINLGLPLDEIQERVIRTLEVVGASHLIKRPTYKLSGGEKRTVAIATVLAMNPDILVMDEPSSNLDPHSRKNLIELLKGFKHLAVDVCERTLIISNGTISADGKSVEIFQNDIILNNSSLERPLRMQGCPICSKKETVK